MIKNTAEKKCKDTADVCELAHRRTVRECKRLKIPLNCQGECNDVGQDHRDKTMRHYGIFSQPIFDRNYNAICEVTGL